MSRSGAARACALFASLSLLTAACGSDGDDAATATSTTSTAAGASGSTTTAPAATTTTTASVPTIEVTYAGGSVTGGVRTAKVALNTKVRLQVTSDVADEIHVHTYDVMADVAAGQTVTLEVDATIPGRHEVELEDLGKPLIFLEVS